MSTERALIALGLRRTAIVLATDSAAIEDDVIEVSPHCDDFGLLNAKDYDDNDPGVYLWEGTSKPTFYTSIDGTEQDGMEYAGTLRPIRPEELEGLLGMSPPENRIEED